MGLCDALKSATSKPPQQKREGRTEADRDRDLALALGYSAPETLAAIPVTPERFRIDVVENIATAGYGTTGLSKYRWHVTDSATGVPQKTAYAMTYQSEYQLAATYVNKHISAAGRRGSGGSCAAGRSLSSTSHGLASPPVARSRASEWSGREKESLLRCCGDRPVNRPPGELEVLAASTCTKHAPSPWAPQKSATSARIESAVNRIKKIKRQLYGRAGFDLLRFAR